MPNRPTQNFDSCAAQRNPAGIQFTAFIRSERFLITVSRDRNRSLLSADGLASPVLLSSSNVTFFFRMELPLSVDEEPPALESPSEDARLPVRLPSLESSLLVLRNVWIACK